MEAPFLMKHEVLLLHWVFVIKYLSTQSKTGHRLSKYLKYQQHLKKEKCKHK